MFPKPFRGTKPFLSKDESFLARTAVVANPIVVAAAAEQQDQNPDPREVAIAPVVVAAVMVAAQAQQDDDPNDATFVTTAKSTHNKIPP